MSATVTDLLPTLDDQMAVTDIDAFAAALAKCFNQLTPEARRHALELCHTLANMRRKLTADARAGTVARHARAHAI